MDQPRIQKLSLIQYKYTHTHTHIYIYIYIYILICRYAATVYHIKDTCKSSYNTFAVKYNRIKIISYKNKILKTHLY